MQAAGGGPQGLIGGMVTVIISLKWYEETLASLEYRGQPNDAFPPAALDLRGAIGERRKIAGVHDLRLG
jgi:hypothetical protein